MIPGAMSVFPEDFGSIVTAARPGKVVVYCAGPNEASAAIAAECIEDEHKPAAADCSKLPIGAGAQ
jgi:hypothetical protein